MAGSVNKVILVGNLGKDPEVRVTQSGVKIVNLILATSESWTDKMTGARQEKTEWHRVVIMNDRLGEIAEKYLRKGSKVFIEGRLQTRKWMDQATRQERYTTEVLLGRFGGEMVLLNAATALSGGEHTPYEVQNETGASKASSVVNATDNDSANGWDAGLIDDDIPF